MFSKVLKMFSKVFLLSFILSFCNCNQVIEREQNLNEPINSQYNRRIETSVKGVDINLNITITSLIVVILIIGVCVGFVLGGGCGICIGMLLTTRSEKCEHRCVYNEEQVDAVDSAVNIEIDPNMKTESKPNDKEKTEANGANTEANGGIKTNASSTDINLKSQL